MKNHDSDARSHIVIVAAITEASALRVFTRDIWSDVSAVWERNADRKLSHGGWYSSEKNAAGPFGTCLQRTGLLL